MRPAYRRADGRGGRAVLVRGNALADSQPWPSVGLTVFYRPRHPCQAGLRGLIDGRAEIASMPPDDSSDLAITDVAAKWSANPTSDPA
ncbi:MAG TPA: hypothetical protein PKK57_14045 [Verrucomicrobiota bacterium]|nr:hypothetical protein [Verrucomicrobiota bacterium]